MLKRKNFINILFPLCFFIFWGAQQLHSNDLSKTAFFRLLSGNTNLLFQLIFVMVLFLVIVCTFYVYQHHNFDYFIVTRIGLKKYYVKCCTSIFLCTFITILLFHLCILLSILGDPNVLPMDSSMLLFSQAPLWNLICYVLLSAIGFALFFLTLYSAAYFIKNKYLFYAFPMFVIFASIFLFATTYSFVSSTVSVEAIDLVKTIFCSITPMNLYTPGMMFEGYGFLSFFTSFLVYGSAFLCLSALTIKGRKQYG